MEIIKMFYHSKYLSRLRQFVAHLDYIQISVLSATRHSEILERDLGTLNFKKEL
jgi:hypothetical protein